MNNRPNSPTTYCAARDNRIMVQKAFDIVKARWPEAIMVVVLQAALMLLAEQLLSISQIEQGVNPPQLPFWAGFLLGMGSILYVILWQMMYLGFLKTAAAEGLQTQPPSELIRSGRPYFWRIVFFQVLLGFVVFFLNGILAGIGGAVFWKGRPLSQIPEWFAQLCGLGAMLIVLKPMLLVPARVLVYDESAFEAFVKMRNNKITKMNSLFKLALAGMVFIVLMTLLGGTISPKTIGHIIFTGLHHLIFSFVFLMPTLAAVLWMQEQYEKEQYSEEENTQ